MTPDDLRGLLDEAVAPLPGAGPPAAPLAAAAQRRHRRRTTALGLLAVAVGAAVPSAVVLSLPTPEPDVLAGDDPGSSGYVSGPADALYPFTTFGDITRWSASSDRDERWGDARRTAEAFAEEWLEVDDATTGPAVPAGDLDLQERPPVTVEVRAAGRTVTVVRLRQADTDLAGPAPWLVVEARSDEVVLDGATPADPFAVDSPVAVSGHAPGADVVEVDRRVRGRELPGDVTGPTPTGGWGANLPAGPTELAPDELGQAEDAVVALAYREGALTAATAIGMVALVPPQDRDLDVGVREALYAPPADVADDPVGILQELTVAWLGPVGGMVSPLGGLAFELAVMADGRPRVLAVVEVADTSPGGARGPFVVSGVRPVGGLVLSRPDGPVAAGGRVRVSGRADRPSASVEVALLDPSGRGDEPTRLEVEGDGHFDEELRLPGGRGTLVVVARDARGIPSGVAATRVD